MATSVGAQVDKEMTVFTGTTHVDNLEAFRSLMFSMILEPGWKEEDFNRVKDDAINFLRVNLRGNNDEELGKEALYLSLYGPDHPYGHQNVGTVTSLDSITLEDVKGFYAKHYTAANITLGLAGGYPAGFPEQAAAALGKLPAGTSSKLTIPQAPAAAGQRLEIIQKETRATAISMGFPIDVTRRDADWAALWLAASYLGQHRSSNGVLYNRLREARGLNYGDYAYTEYFPRGMFQFQPDMNLGRQRQIFQIWIRPVEPANAHFALRAALFEFKKMIDQGISQEDFENTRSFLDKYIPVLMKTQSLQLGSALDGQYYGTGDFAAWARGKLAALTRDDVNRAIRKHWSLQNMMIEIITKDGEALSKAILGNSPSPITYNAPKPAEVMNEDKLIADFPLSIKPENARVVDVESIFEK
jgi:zinc protease